jgi:hypothetical protein
MFNRLKINQIYEAHEAMGEMNDIGREFSQTINRIKQENQKTTSICYVKNPKIESQLQDVKDQDQSNFSILIGETGIGKSTYIRKVFGNDTNPEIINNCISVPFFMNRMYLTKDNHLLRFKEKIQATARLILGEDADYEEISEDFYQFIKSKNKHLLEIKDFFAKATNKEILADVKKEDFYGYYTELLKYACIKKNIQKIVIIYDDWESISELDVLFELINIGCHFYECCAQSLKEEKIIVTTVMAIRPSTRLALANKEWFSAYTPYKEIMIREPVDLKSIYLAQIKNDPMRKNTTREEEVFEILDKYVNGLPQVWCNMLTEYANYNIREALNMLSGIITNRRYIQGGATPMYYFKAEEEDFHFNKPNIARSMILKESELYLDNDGSIFNILKNNDNEKSDLIVAYICKYFFILNDGKYISLKRVAEDLLYKDIKLIGIDHEVAQDSLKYLIEKRVVDKVTVDKDTIYYSACPRLFAPFSVFKQNSVLCDVLRDDVYLDKEELSHGYLRYPITKMIEQNKLDASIAFLHCIVNTESNLRNRINPSSRQYFCTKFGEKMLVSDMLEGYRHMLYATRNSDDKRYKNLLRLVENHEKNYI